MKLCLVMLKSGKLDPDRLARRYSYQELVMDELKEAGIEVLFITVPPIKNENDQMLYEMRGAFARYERTKIAERFRLGKLRKVREGHILTTEAHYGCTYIRNDKEKKEHGYYLINEEEEAEVIRMICKWIDVENLTLRKVVKRLQEKGIKPRKNKNGVWNTSTLSTLLRNRALIGEAHYGASTAIVPTKPFKEEKYKRNKKSSRRMKPESEWIKIPVPAIIDEPLFMRIQEKLKRNAQLSKRNKKNDYLLSGKIRCACGNTRSGEGPQHGKYLYYRCSSRVLSFPLPPVCQEKGINAKIADNLLWTQIEEIMSSPKMMAEQINRWMTSHLNRGKFSVNDIKSMEAEISKLKEAEDRYTKAYGSGFFTVEKLKEYVEPIREKIVLLQSQVNKAMQEKGDREVLAFPNQKEMKIFAQKAKELLKNLNFETKQAIVRAVLSGLVASQKQLDAKGVLNLNEINVLFNNIQINQHVLPQTIHRNRRSTKRGEVHAF